MKRGELSIHNQKPIRRTLLNKNGAVAIIRTDANIVAVASAG